MGPVLLIGRYPYSHWVLDARPEGIESYRVLPHLGVVLRDHGSIAGSLWLLRFVTTPTHEQGSGLVAGGVWVT